jgi:hypothetical protein
VRLQARWFRDDQTVLLYDLSRLERDRVIDHSGSGNDAEIQGATPVHPEVD